jgi:polysaccharide biosynthesis/export protein
VTSVEMRVRSSAGSMRPLCALVRVVSCAAALLFAGGARAQSQPAKDGRISESTDLEKENQSYVAAAPAEIENILRANPGLMIELKRWVAEEATQQGRILGEADLSDGAIDERLREDTKFRAVATKLLQRYGYLTPALEPHSEIARENQAWIEARAKWLAERQETDRARARAAAARSQGCEPPRAAGCGDRSGNLPEEASPEDTSPEPTEDRQAFPAAPERQIPRNSSPLETATDFDQQDETFADDLALGGSLAVTAGEADSYRPAYQASRVIDGSLAHANLDREDSQRAPGEFPAERRLEPSSDDGDTLTQGARASTGRANREDSTSARGRDDSRPEAKPGRDSARGDEMDSRGMVPKRHPYDGVPALADMYMQAAPQARALERFGVGVFRPDSQMRQHLPMDLPVGPEYVVGPGDTLAIDLWGGVSRRLTRTVDREGRLSLPEIGPLLVSGKSLGEVQQSVQDGLRTEFREISADVSLARLRTVRVYVVGDVALPGAYDVSSLSTPLNALFIAGGPTERGSLRQAEHLRGKQVVEEVDLYALLLHGVKTDLARLEDGDSILVPPIGPSVTVEGMVRRPAVYELRGEKNLWEALELAGGILPSASLDHIEIERLEAHQQRTMVSLSISPGESAEAVRTRLGSFAIRDQDVVRLFPIAAYNEQAVYLEGHVLRPGRYAYHDGMKFTDVVAGYSDLMPEPAETYAEVIHLSAPDYAPKVESFNLGEALAGRTVPILKPMDTVRIFGKYDFENVPTVSVWGEVREPGTYRATGEVHLRDALHLAGGTTPDAMMDSAQVFRTLPDSTLKVFSVDLEKALGGDAGANIVLESRDRIVVHRNAAKVDPPTVYVKGEIAKPGRYPLTAHMRVSDLVRVGGGLRRGADPEVASLTQFRITDTEKVAADERPVNLEAALAKEPESDLALRDGDTLTIREITGWNDRGAAIVVRGEVEHPGTYGIAPGERLSSILERAGGFSAAAYPHGAVFERVEVREEEERSQRSLIERVQQERQALNELPENDSTQKAAKAAAMSQWQRIFDNLATNPPIGRLVIHVSASIRTWRNTPNDIPVRAGDVLMVPKTPGFVLVSGQVYNPTAITYRPGRNAGWYLGQGGGPTSVADRKAIFVVRADGSVMNSDAMASLWKGRAVGATLEPGDTVVVPEKAVGRNIAWQSVFLAGQVASSVATAVLVAVHY